MELTQYYLKEMFSYDPNTGLFTRKGQSGRRIDQVGKQAGSLRPSGYVAITIDQKSYQAHRLAWLYVYGEFPESYIDHINSVKSDNRIINLRLATKGQNNTYKKGRAKSGLKGAYWQTQSKCWYSKIGKIYLGTFKTAEEANAAFVAAAKKIYGEFFHD